jgi:hypothetical protein
MHRRIFILLFPLVFLFACVPGSRIEAPGLKPLTGENISSLNGRYNLSIWQYFAPMQKEKYTDTTSYKVAIEAISPRRLAAKVVYSDTIVVDKKILKGHLTGGYFSVKPRTLPLGIPLLYFQYYKNKVDIGMKENSDLYLSVNEFRLVNFIIIAAGKRSSFSGTFKKK